jgi:hypothetical protein
MFTISFLLAITLFISLRLILRARAAFASRKATALFATQMLAQFEQMEAALSASDREFTSLMREQRKLEQPQKPKEKSTAPKRNAKLETKPEVKPRSPRQKCTPTNSPSALSAPPCETLTPPISPSITSSFFQQCARALTSSVKVFYRPIYLFTRVFSSYFFRPKPPAPPLNIPKQSQAA